MSSETFKAERRAAQPREEVQKLSLSEAANHLLEECRMVLPGIQALFGFQLIAVFSDGFSEKLGAQEQSLHLLAIGLVVIAVALIMTPAAYHRQQGGREVTERFIRISTRLLLWSMAPLATALCLDLYLVMAAVIDGTFAPLLAALVFAVLLVFWFVLPRSEALKRLVG